MCLVTKTVAAVHYVFLYLGFNVKVKHPLCEILFIHLIPCGNCWSNLLSCGSVPVGRQISQSPREEFSSAGVDSDVAVLQVPSSRTAAISHLREANKVTHYL